MPNHSQVVTVSVAEPCEGDGSRWWNSVAKAWPSHVPPPQARLVPFASLIRVLEERSYDGNGLDEPLLIVVNRQTPDHIVFQIVDELQRAALPALVLFPDPSSVHRELEQEGVLIASYDTDPVYIAASLFALAQRQRTIRSLSGELKLAVRTQGGFRGEMDRIHDELNLAAAVQQEMLPKAMPDIGGVDCAALMRPAGYVSGDIYDLAAIDKDRLAFFIADAVGHGVPAALMTMVISRALRAVTPGDALSPGRMLARLNDELVLAQRDAARFTTAIYGVYDASSRRVTIASAGHPPPLLIGPSGATRVPTEGALLGIFPGERYDELEFDLNVGETLLLFSDGFEVAFGEENSQHHVKTTDVLDGTIEHYVQRLASLHWPDGYGKRTAAEALIDLATLLDSQAGSLHQIDDLTAIVISGREPQDERLVKADSMARAA